MESTSGVQIASLSAYRLHPTQGGSTLPPQYKSNQRAKEQIGGNADGPLARIRIHLLALQHNAKKKVAPCDQRELKQTSNAVV